MKSRSVGIIGAGRVGTALGLALIRAGYRVRGISARSGASRDRAGQLLPEVPVVDPYAAAGGDILILTVSDAAIEAVCTQLAGAGKLRQGQYVMHTSGAFGLAVLRSASDAGAVPLAVHPAMTFPGLRTDVDAMAGLHYAITSPPRARPDAERFVRDLGGVPVWVDDADRTLYHAALVLAANNLVTLVAAAMEALTAANVAEPGLVLGPLVRAALENALRLGDEALTGPVRRADTATIEAHIRALRQRAGHLLPTYLGLGLVTADRARQAGLARVDALDQVTELLRHHADQNRPVGDDE